MESAKEKAKELVYKYYNAMNPYAPDCSISFNQAKQCALIAVDEILQKGMLENAPFMRNGKDLLNNSNAIRYKDYWQEVKQEINEL